jgi:hypothetical protein
MTCYGDAGDHEIFVGGGAGNSQNITSRTRPGIITIIPSGLEAHWDIAGSFDVSHIHLSPFRFQK